MNYVSTRNRNLIINSCEAVYAGIAPDGGLFVPEQIPKLDIPLSDITNMNYRELATKIINTMLPDFGFETISKCVIDGYSGKFNVPECVKLVNFENLSFLELYHGPTAAFKDMALCILPRLVVAAASILNKKEKTVILTATSGDTGKAALEGFKDVPNTDIIVFYPEKGVSDVQKLQMQTQLGNNVYICGVNGNFDDAQSGVKKAFKELSIKGLHFSSANSINVGRLVPQICYYFYSYGQLVKNNIIKLGEKLNFSVPTGNFGDILAGWFAKKMGLPVGKLLCASNKNNILSDFIKTGIYDCRRPFFTTVSPSMDILISSNLERLLYYASGCNSDYIKELMNQLAENKFFKVKKDVLEAIQKDFDCDWANEEQCLQEINKLWTDKGYLIDTHTAVASYCAEKTYKEPCVILSTANPYKFSSSILRALGSSGEGFEAINLLNSITNVPIPGSLSDLKDRPVRFKETVNPDEIISKIKNLVGGIYEQ